MKPKSTPISIRRVTCTASVLLFFCTGMLFGRGQGSSAPNSIDDLSVSGVDLTVPDAPAFKLVDVAEDRIMRPASLQDLAATVDPNQGFAVEFAPLRLAAGRNLTYQQLRDGRLKYTTTISFGLVKDENNAFDKAAVGIRLNLIDKADYRFRDDISAISGDILDSLNAINLLYANNPDAVLSPEGEKAVKQLESKLNNVIDSASTDKWAGTVVQIGLASGAMSRDSAGGNIGLFRHAVWLSAAGPCHSGRGQWLLGFVGEANRESGDGPWIGEGTAAARLYLGSNRFKVYGSGQASFADASRPVWLGQAGTEFHLAGGLWADANIGWQDSKDFDKGRMTTGYSLKFAGNVGGGK